MDDEQLLKLKLFSNSLLQELILNGKTFYTVDNEGNTEIINEENFNNLIKEKNG
jgi:hypothetical protein